MKNNKKSKKAKCKHTHASTTRIALSLVLTICISNPMPFFFTTKNTQRTTETTVHKEQLQLPN